MKRADRLLSLIAIFALLLMTLTLFSACGGGDSTQVAEGGGIYESYEEGGISDVVILVGIEEGVTDLVIPEKVDGKDVQTIAPDALRGNTTLKSVTFNTKLYERFDIGAIIPSGAFSGCTALEGVTVNGKSRIADGAFENCPALNTVIAPEAIGDIEFGNQIYTDPFGESTEVKTLDMPARFFYYSSKLFDAFYKIPASVCELTLRGSFDYPDTTISLPSLRTVSFKGNVTGRLTLKDCPELVSVECNGGATLFPSLNNCPKISEVTLPEGFTNPYGRTVFKDCAALERINVSNIESYLKINLNGGALATNNGVAYAKLYIGGKRLEEICIPDTVTAIGPNQFKGVDITSLNVGKGVTEIGKGAFEGCKRLTDVVFSDQVTKIGEYAFKDTGLRKVTLGLSVTEIGKGAFEGCKRLTDVVIPDQVTKIGEYAFKDTGLKKVTLGLSVTEIGSGAFANTPKLREVYNLSSLSITKGAHAHGSVALNAFAIYDRLDAPSLLGNEGDFLFYTDGAKHILYEYIGEEKSIVLPESYKGARYVIGERAFSGLKLYSVTIPEGVFEISHHAFSGSTVARIDFKGKDTVTYATSFYASKLAELFIPEGMTAYVPYYSLTAGCKTLYGGTGASILTVEYGMAFIERDGMPLLLFYAGESEELTLPDNIGGRDYVISNKAFVDTQIKKISLPTSGVVAIEEDAFYGLELDYEVDGRGKYLSGWLIEYSIDDRYDGLFKPKAGTVGIAGGALVYNFGKNTTITDYTPSATARIAFPESLKYLSSGWFGITGVAVKDPSDAPIPEGLVYIGEGAIPFADTLSLPKVKYLGARALSGKTVTGSFTIYPDSVIGEGAISAYFDELILADGATLPADAMIKGFGKLTVGSGVRISDSKKNFSNYVFENNSGGTFGEVAVGNLGDYLSFAENMKSSCDSPLSLGGSLTVGGEELQGAITVEGVERIGSYAFYGCDITDVTIGEGVKEVPYGVFDGCEELVSIRFSPSVESFMELFSRFEKVEIPSIEWWLALKKNHGIGGLPVYMDGEIITEVFIPESVTVIPQSAFYNWRLERIVLHDKVTVIEFNSLYSPYIGAIEGGAGVTELADYYKHESTEDRGYVFGNVRYGLTGPIAPLSTNITWARLKADTYYPAEFFKGCSQLIQVYAHKGVTLGDSVFSSVGKEFTVFFEDSAPTGSAWYNVYTSEGTERIGAGGFGYLHTYVWYEGDYAFEKVGNGATVIGYFGDSVDLTIPATLRELAVEKLGARAFYMRTDIQSVKLPESVKTLGAMAFFGCSFLKTAELGSVTDIDIGCFGNCISLTEITLPVSLKTVGIGAFAGCSNLARVYFTGGGEYEVYHVVALDRNLIATVNVESPEQNAVWLRADYSEYFFVKKQ